MESNWNASDPRLEQQAVELVERNNGQIFICLDPKSRMNQQKGSFAILEDMNCCAPTLNVLFSFENDQRRQVMSAEELLAFFDLCQKAD